MKRTIQSVEDVHRLIDEWSKPGALEFPFTIDIKTERSRTMKQNRSIRLFCSMLALSLNNGGLDIKKVFEVKEVSVPWSPETVLELLWRPIQLALFNKRSTTQLETAEVSKVYDVLNRHISSNFGVSVQFPSVETAMNEQQYQE